MRIYSNTIIKSYIYNGLDMVVLFDTIDRNMRENISQFFYFLTIK